MGPDSGASRSYRRRCLDARPASSRGHMEGENRRALAGLHLLGGLGSSISRSRWRPIETSPALWPWSRWAGVPSLPRRGLACGRGTFSSRRAQRKRAFDSGQRAGSASRSPGSASLTLRAGFRVEEEIVRVCVAKRAVRGAGHAREHHQFATF